MRNRIALLTATTLAGVAALAAPARAAGYDPAPLCAASTPTAAQLSTALDTVQADTEAAVAAGGLTVRATTSGLKGLYRVDAAAVRSRTDTVSTFVDERYAEHEFTDAASARTFTGHLSSDGRDQASAIALLKKSEQAWSAAAEKDTARLTVPGLVDQGLRRLSAFGLLLESTASTTETHAYTCTADATASSLVITDSVSLSGLRIKDTLTYTFTDTGALAGIRWASTADGQSLPAYAETFSYAPVSLALLTQVVSAKAWDGAYVRGAFTNLQKDSVKAARTAVAKQETAAMRISALRSAVKTKVARYQAGKVARTNVTNGVRVTVRKAHSTQYWSFTLTVSGKTVKVKSNLP